MTPITPLVQPLPQKQRQHIFVTAILVFLVAVPLFVFYAMGYRFDFFNINSNSSISVVGGIYITSAVADVEMFIDDAPVQNVRVFQSAAYIQNLESGMHQIHVQGNGIYTWVKKLPVFPHFVTEAQSFNMPLVPQTRIITTYTEATGNSVFFGATSSLPISFASSTSVLVATTSTATSSYTVNAEYEYVTSLFASSSETSTLLKNKRLLQIKNRFTFGSDETATTTIATTTKTYQDTRLYEDDGEVYIQWTGKAENVPYYYCVRFDSAHSTTALYGAHVGASLQAQIIAANESTSTVALIEGQKCRNHIRIDRLGSQVIDFDYFPNSRDLVLMHLQDGLYVVEADDRAWQNTQLLYPGENITVVVDGGQIFVKDGKYYAEVFTALQQ